MSMFAKIMVLVNLVLAVVFLAAAGTLHGAAENWKAKHAETKARLEKDVQAVTEQRDVRQKELEAKTVAQGESEKRAVKAETDARNTSESNTVLKTENDRLKAENTQHVANAGDLAKTITAQEARIKELTDNLATASTERNAARDENKTLAENLARETTRADDAEKAAAAAGETNKKQADDIDRLTTEKAAYAKAFGPLPGGGVMKPLTGVVAATSAKDDVHIVSVGSKDGVEIGYEFTVFRGSEYVSTIVIDWVGPTSSAGKTKSGMKKSEIKPGDSVSTKL